MFIRSIVTHFGITGGDDYVSGPYTVKFTAGMVQKSFNITITNDRTLESDEMFQLSINSNLLPNHVIVDNPSSSTVTIEDDDGKQNYYFVHNIIYQYT